MTYQTIIMTGRAADNVVRQLLPALQDRVPDEIIARLQQAQEPASSSQTEPEVSTAVWPATIEEAMGMPPRKRMGRPPIPLAGQVFDTLLVIEQAKSNEHGWACWRCRCQACGAERVESGQRLREGDKVFCPCTGKQPRGFGRTRKDGSWPKQRPKMPELPGLSGQHTKAEVIAALRANGVRRHGRQIILGNGQIVSVGALRSVLPAGRSPWPVLDALPEEIAA